MEISKAALKSVYPDGGGVNNRKLDELLRKYKLDAKDMKLYNNLLKLFTASNDDLSKIRAYREKTGKGGPGSINRKWSRNLEDRSAEFSAKLLLLSALQQEERNEAESEQEVEENFADGKKKGKSRPGRVKRSGASCKGSVTSLRAKAKKYSGERGKMYHWCANMKGGKKKKKKTNEGVFDELPLPTWMSHTSLEKMFRQEYGERYGDYLAYMDLDSDDDLAMSSDFGKMALDVAKEHDIKEMNKFLSQTPVQFKVDDLRLDQGVQVWHLVQQPTTIH